jgi:predicted  nucleic acid-binding Zn-ribbon protein
VRACIILAFDERMANDYSPSTDVNSQEHEALSDRLDEILQAVRRIETELHVLTARVEQTEDSPPLEPLEKVAD